MGRNPPELACLLFAAANARMNAAYLRVGLDGCDKGSSYLLPWPVGRRCGAGRDKLDFAAIDPGADAGDQSCV